MKMVLLTTFLMVNCGSVFAQTEKIDKSVQVSEAGQNRKGLQNINKSADEKNDRNRAARGPNGAALSVRSCDEKTPTNLEYYLAMKSYANESIRVFSVDTYGEPACCSHHVVIYMPEKDQPMAYKCFHIAANIEGLGFNGVDLQSGKAVYSAKSGLSLKLPFLFYNPESGGASKKFYTLLINQATQTIELK